jgi:hypothetical protein
MRLNRILLLTLALLAAIAGIAPASALAGGPLLSGYGGPGAGDQAILGATLVGGPSGGSGGGGSGSASAAGAGARGASVPSSAGVATTAGRSARPTSPGSSGARAGTLTANQQRAGGTNSKSSPQLEDLSAVGGSAAAQSWFTGGDLLALALVAGVLALVAVTTLRLTRTRHG